MNKRLNILLKKIIISSILFLLILILPLNFYTKISMYMLTYLIIGYEILLKSFKNILNRNMFDENLLMTIATIVAFALGEYAEAVAIILLYQIGEFFQGYAVNNSRKSIAKLMDIRPDFANIEKNGEIVKINPEDVNVGDIIIVKVGEKIPLDGLIVSGQSSLDVSALTGESLPIDLKEEDEVVSGSINLGGVLKIKALKKYSESTISKILNLVEEATNKKAKVENFITKFARYYTPSVVIVAFFIAILPPLFFENQYFSNSLYKAMVFLVVSCPCALVISVPLSFFAGIGVASKNGILIKGGNYLELLSQIKYFVFDKTGTLTKGNFSVIKIKPFNIEEGKLLEICAYAESYSNHPIAISIRNKYREYGEEINLTRIKDIQEIQGKGIKASIDNDIIYVGNEKIMQEFNIDYQEAKELGTIIYVAVNNIFIGYIVIADEIKNNVNKDLKELYNLGIQKTIMLTGDKNIVALDVGKKVGVDEIYSELLPHNKIEKLEKIIQDNPDLKIAFVGDGINDAPVLARSNLGIAMGGIGSQAAIEAADIVIMNDKISSIARAIKISKKTLRVVKQNIVFSIGTKMIVLLLGLFGYTSIWGAVFADVGVCCVAIGNSLRVLYEFKKNSSVNSSIF